MWRHFAWLVAALLECALFGWLPEAAASHDPLSTAHHVEGGVLAQASEAVICPKDKIKSPLTLLDVVELALCNNPSTRIMWANARSQAAQLGSSKSSYLPTLSGPVSVSRSRSEVGASANDSSQKSIGVTATYLLYDFGGREAGVENAKQLLIAANATRDETLQDAYLGATQAYYALLSARASVQAYFAAEAAASLSMDAAQTRYKAGMATQADRLQAQTALSQAVLNRIRAEGEAANAQGTLANAMGFDASQPFELAPVSEAKPDLATERSIGDLLAEARRSRPDLRAAEAQIRAAEENLTAVRASGLPVVNLNGTLSRTTSQANGISTTSFGKTVGVSVSMPWFSGFRDTYRKRAAKEQVESKVAERDRVANQAALEVWKAYQELLTNSQALRAAEDLVASAEESEKMALGRYKAGVGSILDTLTAQSTLASANQQRVVALYNFLASKFVLAQSIGELDLTLIGNGRPGLVKND